MSVSLKKPFKHFATNALFYGAKVSVNAENTSYIQNGEVHEGTPDILWEHTVFIHDIAQIWNRGRYYNSQKYLGKLAAITKNAFQMYSGMTIVTLVDKNPGSMDVSDYADYPGILPSIVVAPGAVQDIDVILSLANKGCDILSTALTGQSVYDGNETKANNYDNILEDMIAVEQWFADHGLLTNCYKYPDAAKAPGESEFIQRYEEYGLVEAATAVNGTYQDNMLLNGKVINDSNVGEAITEIANGNGAWLVYILDGLSTEKIALLNEAIQDGIDHDTCIYMQMHEGLQMRASEFNVGRSENTLPFRVYKDGKVDADLTASSVEHITETVIEEVAQELPGDGLTYNTTTGKLDWDSSVMSAYQADWDEDDSSSYAYIINKPEVEDAVTYESEKLVTSGATYAAIADVERIAAEAIAELKTTYIDTMWSAENMQKIMWYVAQNLFAYMSSQGEDFLMID